MSRRFGLQQAPFSKHIQVGLINPERTCFLSGDDLFDEDTGELTKGMDTYLENLHHEDCTDMAIRVVADYILDQFEGKLAISFKSGDAFKITVERTSADEIDGPDTQAP